MERRVLSAQRSDSGVGGPEKIPSPAAMSGVGSKAAEGMTEHLDAVMLVGGVALWVRVMMRARVGCTTLTNSQIRLLYH